MDNRLTKNQIKPGLLINNYTILEKAGTFDGKSDERPMWKVRCKCGLIKIKVNRYIRRQLNCGSDCGLRTPKKKIGKQ